MFFNFNYFLFVSLISNNFIFTGVDINDIVEEDEETVEFLIKKEVTIIEE